MSTYAGVEHLCVGKANVEQTVAFEERAASLEYDNGLSRVEAEARATAEFPDLPDFLRRVQWASVVNGGSQWLGLQLNSRRQIGLDVATFRSWVECGRLPKPLPDCGKFDLKAIDVALDRISGLGNVSNALDAWREWRAGERSYAD
jgi:hypothetical protein